MCRLLCIVLFVLSAGGNVISMKDDAECNLNGYKYKIGETWHPFLAPFGAMPCVNCTCLQDGSVSCVHLTHDCPKPKCDDPKILPNRCCPECEVRTKGQLEPNTKADCSFHGESYRHGYMFPSNQTALKPTRNNQCVMCICSNSNVLCHLKTCPIVSCSKPFYDPEDCCPRCADEKKETLSISFVDHTPALNYSEIDDPSVCSRVNGVHPNGSSWHPVLTPFGPILCVLCTCLNGRVQCDKIVCTPPHLLPCSRPQKVEGQCCKVCPKVRRKCKGKKNEECKKSRKSKNQIGTGLTSISGENEKTQTTSVDPTQIFHNLCMPKRTNMIVYRSDETSSFMLAFHHIKKSRVIVFTWKVPKKGRLSEMQIETMAAVDFRQRTKSTTILGATKKKKYRIFKKKAKKRMKRCKKTCGENHILKLLKKLRLKKIHFTENCNN